jgi:phosphatidylinositol glycan class B
MLLRLIQCYFFTYNMGHPDEYWQAIEPAYNMVYGNVFLPWEWDDFYRLRSVIYPAYLAVPLYILKVTGLDTAVAVRACPQMAHAVLVILFDRMFWSIGK